MSITSDLIRGHTETIIMAQLNVDDSYGYKINKAIQEASDGQYELKEATLYGAFRRLEDNGYILSYWGDETTGARRRYYRLTPKGKDFFNLCRAEWEYAKELIDKLVEAQRSHEQRSQEDHVEPGAQEEYEEPGTNEEQGKQGTQEHEARGTNEEQEQEVQRSQEVQGTHENQVTQEAQEANAGKETQRSQEMPGVQGKQGGKKK